MVRKATKTRHFPS